MFDNICMYSWVKMQNIVPSQVKMHPHYTAAANSVLDCIEGGDRISANADSESTHFTVSQSIAACNLI